MNHVLLNVALQVPAQIEAKARYALRVLATIWGVPLRFVNGTKDPVALAYGVHPFQVGHSVFLPCDLSAYVDETPHQTIDFDGVTVWGPKDKPPQDVDLLGSVFRLLTFLDESQVAEQERNSMGVFTTSSLPPARRAACTEPLVENHAAVLLQKLVCSFPHLQAIAAPPWPGGKKYALVVTHDTDAITIGAPLEMLFALAKAFRRQDRNFLRMFGDGFRYWNRPTDNPLFGFANWRNLEAPRVHSCFYLFARPKWLKRHLHDCRSSVVEQPIAWNILQSMADEGWEFGFHAPINAQNDEDTFSWGKEFIEQKLGAPIFGVRHHYWALDWRRPYRTFRKHISAGYQYDSSIAWRDSLGFRAGTCLPFKPFDLEHDRILDICEIPTTIMDGHVRNHGKSQDKNVDDILQLVAKTKAHRGVITMDWHTESVCNDYCYRGDTDVLLKALAAIIHDSDVWLAKPCELTAYWNRRWTEMTEECCAQ